MLGFVNHVAAGFGVLNCALLAMRIRTEQAAWSSRDRPAGLYFFPTIAKYSQPGRATNLVKNDPGEFASISDHHRDSAQDVVSKTPPTTI